MDVIYCKNSQDPEIFLTKVSNYVNKFLSLFNEAPINHKVLRAPNITTQSAINLNLYICLYLQFSVNFNCLTSKKIENKSP